MSSGVAFSDLSVWPVILLMGVILGGLLLGNALKRAVPFLRKSLIPVSVLGGGVLLIISTICKLITGKYFVAIGINEITTVILFVAFCI